MFDIAMIGIGFTYFILSMSDLPVRLVLQY
jgi:hypothetical protein